MPTKRNIIGFHYVFIFEMIPYKGAQDLFLYMISENITESWVLEGFSKAVHITLPCGTGILLRVVLFPGGSTHLLLATRDYHNQVLVLSCPRPDATKCSN